MEIWKTNRPFWIKATFTLISYKYTKETPRYFPSLSINTDLETHNKKATFLGNNQVTPRGVTWVLPSVTWSTGYRYIMAEIVIFSLPRECNTIWYAKKGSFLVWNIIWTPKKILCYSLISMRPIYYFDTWAIIWHGIVCWFMVFSPFLPVLVCCDHKIVLHWYENQKKNNLVIMLRKSS